MKKISILMLLMAALSLASCNHTSVSEFVDSDTVRLEIDGTPVFVYSDNDCQLSFNRTRNIFRAQTDTALEWFSVSLDEVPERDGDKTLASVSWSTNGIEKARNNITLEAHAVKGDVIWLCDNTRRVAVVVRILE